MRLAYHVVNKKANFQHDRFMESPEAGSTPEKGCYNRGMTAVKLVEEVLS